METNEISLQLFRCFEFVKGAGRWVSVKEVAAAAGVSRRCADNHTRRLARAGILDVAEVYPGHRFRYAAKADKRNRFLQRLEESAEVFNDFK